MNKAQIPGVMALADAYAHRAYQSNSMRDAKGSECRSDLEAALHAMSDDDAERAETLQCTREALLDANRTISRLQSILAMGQYGQGNQPPFNSPIAKARG